MVDPAIKAIGDAVVAYYNGAGIILEFSRFAEHRDSLTAELHVTNEVGSLHWSRINLATVAGGRRDVIKALEEIHPIEGWRAMVDRACQLVAIHVRTGDPPQELTPTPPSERRWLVTPWVPRNQITVLYGPGGTAKSLFALATMLSGLMGHTLGSPWAVGHLERVLYLDWEADKLAHDENAWALLHAIEALPPKRFYHKHLRRPLTDVITEVRADAGRLEVDAVVMDSLGAAAGPEPEGASAALGTLQALGSLPGSKMVIAHESKAALDMAQGTPFGSVYVWNTARSCIEIRPQDVSEPNTLTVNLRHAKNNLGPKAKPLGLTFSFGESITISRTTPDSTAKTLSDRVLDALNTHHPLGITPLARMLGQNEAKIRSILYRHEQHNRVLRAPSDEGGKVQYLRVHQ